MNFSLKTRIKLFKIKILDGYSYKTRHPSLTDIFVYFQDFHRLPTARVDDCSDFWLVDICILDIWLAADGSLHLSRFFTRRQIQLLTWHPQTPPQPPPQILPEGNILPSDWRWRERDNQTIKALSIRRHWTWDESNISWDPGPQQKQSVLARNEINLTHF